MRTMLQTTRDLCWTKFYFHGSIVEICDQVCQVWKAECVYLAGFRSQTRTLLADLRLQKPCEEEVVYCRDYL